MWPVGAVSITMRLKCAYSGELMNCTTLLMATASSTPGGSVSSSSPGAARALAQQRHSTIAAVPRQCWKHTWCLHIVQNHLPIQTLYILVFLWKTNSADSHTRRRRMAGPH